MQATGATILSATSFQPFEGSMGLEGAAGMAWVGLRVRLLGGVCGLGAAELLESGGGWLGNCTT